MGGNGDVDFKEFAALLLVAMAQTQEGAQKVTRESFMKMMYYLMDVDGDGTISQEEFVHMCSCSTELGLINVKDIEKMCEQRLGPEYKKGKGDLRTIYDQVFLLYDYDGSGDIGEAEWSMFATDWLDEPA